MPPGLAGNAFGRTDAELHEALVAAYGPNAGDARYLPEQEHPEHIRKLMEEFRTAGDTWRESVDMIDGGQPHYQYLASVE